MLSSYHPNRHTYLIINCAEIECLIDGIGLSDISCQDKMMAKNACPHGSISHWDRRPPTRTHFRHLDDTREQQLRQFISGAIPGENLRIAAAKFAFLLIEASSPCTVKF